MSVKIKQRDIKDCGAACIASIASHYKLELPLSKIRQLASTDRKGTNVKGLLEAMEELGFQAKGVRGEMDCLTKIPKPAIAHTIVNHVLHHYVVLYQVTNKFVKVMDPGDGHMHRYSLEEFKKFGLEYWLSYFPERDLSRVITGLLHYPGCTHSCIPIRI